MTMDYKTYLEHYGVLGMHWGVRKDRNGVRRGRRRRTPSEDYILTKDLRKKHLSEMSNVELRQLNERLNLESQYLRMSQTKIHKGQKFIADILKEMGKEAAKNAVKETVKFTYTDARKKP